MGRTLGRPTGLLAGRTTLVRGRPLPRGGGGGGGATGGGGGLVFCPTLLHGLAVQQHLFAKIVLCSFFSKKTVHCAMD
eukprot:3590208-Amphidinium_carterae.1